MKNKLVKIYTCTIIIIGILNLITGIYFLIQTSLIESIAKIFSYPELPLLFFSAIMIIHIFRKKLKKIHLVLPIVNLIVYLGLYLIQGNFATTINFLLYIFYVSFGIYLLEKY